MPRKRRTEPWWRFNDTGVAYVFWYDEKERQTRRRSLGTSDSGEARQRFALFLLNGEADARGDADLTVRQAIRDYDREHVDKHVAAAQRQRVALDHLETWFGDRPFSKVTINDCRAYGDARRRGEIGGPASGGGFRSAGDSTIRRELNALQAVANHAAHWRRMGPNATPATAMPSIELPTLTQDDEHVVKWMSKDVIRRLLDTTEGDLHDFIAIAYYTGSRKAAITSLTAPQVDLRVGRINLHRPGDRKTKKRKPIVPLFPEIRGVIERRMLAAQETGRSRLFDMNDPYRAFCNACADIGVEGNPHMLRHSRATHMLMDGEDIYKVARLLGDTVATVERVYGHVMTEYLHTTSSLAG